MMFQQNSLSNSRNAIESDDKDQITVEELQDQNANVDEHSFGGRIGEAARVVCKNDALKNVMSRSQERITRITRSMFMILTAIVQENIIALLCRSIIF